MTSTRSNLRKAAVLLSSLPSEQRSQLLDRLELRQSTAVAAEIARAGRVAGAERAAVAREFAGARSTGLEHGETQRAAPFQFLYDLDRDCLLGLLGDERPQAIAMVLRYLPPRQAAAVLAELTPARQFSVVCRIAVMREPSPEAIVDVENGLRRRLSGGAFRPSGSRRLAGVVKMLNRMDPAAERALLGTLAKADPRLVRKIRREMFGADVAGRHSAVGIDT